MNKKLEAIAERQGERWLPTTRLRRHSKRMNTQDSGIGNAQQPFARPLGSATTLRAEVDRAEERLRNDPCTQSRRVLSEASAAWRRAICDDNHTNQSND